MAEPSQREPQTLDYHPPERRGPGALDLILTALAACVCLCGASILVLLFAFLVTSDRPQGGVYIFALLWLVVAVVLVGLAVRFSMSVIRAIFAARDRR